MRYYHMPALKYSALKKAEITLSSDNLNLARKQPALSIACNIDMRSVGVAPSALSERITSLRLALALTFCNEPPFSLTLTLVLRDTTVLPPAKGYSVDSHSLGYLP